MSDFPIFRSQVISRVEQIRTLVKKLARYQKTFSSFKPWLKLSIKQVSQEHQIIGQ